MTVSPREGPRTVIVDDDIDTLELLAEVLHAEGIAVVGCATTGQAAIGLVAEVRPSVVLLDIRMPGMDGFKTAQALRRLVPMPEVVFLTAYAELLPGAAHEFGGYAYLVKGCSAALMRDVITAAAAARV
jgi:response regulator NasT